MNIIGISAHFHDSACVLLRNGELIAAAEEERFSRIKHDPSIPQNAFRFCLDAGDISITDIDCIAYYEDPTVKLGRQLWMGLPDPPPKDLSSPYSLDAGRPEREIRQILGFEGKILFCNHHLSHAASSFYYSGFDEAAILTVDGVGEWASTMYGMAKGSEIRQIEEVHFPHSLGLFYSTITSYLGFEVNDGEYKVMGLAGYGSSRYEEPMWQLLDSASDGQFALNLKYFDFVGGHRMFSNALPELFGRAPRKSADPIEEFHQDIARSAQNILEKILLQKTRYLYAKTGCKNLCLSGGVALNCSANGVLSREGPFANVFVQPAASDAGGALGAASIAHVRLMGERPQTKALDQVFLGPQFGDDEIARLLRASGIAALDLRNQFAKLVDLTASRLALGKIVGWFQGRMEFGPRALGARSILADPRLREIRDRVNSLVKRREQFRPFAPAVLESKAAEYFEITRPTRFMTESVQVKHQEYLAGTTHVDGSARLQTVDKQTNPRFADLLERFERYTGCPVLLNTSFNLKDEPIVCTPNDALICFIRASLDLLVLGSFIVRREDVSDELRRLCDRPRNSSMTNPRHNVYSFI